jgi:hypothetical protein
MIRSSMMRTLHLAGPLLAFVTAFAAYGCTLDVAGLSPTTSTSGMPTTGSAGGAEPTSASVSGSGGANATTSASATTGTSAASTTGTGCIPKQEDCTNGVDDDCDEDIDCADSDCTGASGAFQCAPDTADGWTVVTFDGNAAGQCPSGYGNLTSVASEPANNGADCSCNCGSPQLNPCTQGVLTLNFGIMGCGGSVIAGTSSGTGACDSLASKVPQISNKDQATTMATKLAVKATACDATATPSVDPPIGAVTCTPTGPSGAGCPNQTACVPKAATGSVCIQHEGAMSCPAGGPMQRRIVAAPADVIDNRTCGACTCSSSATSCSGAKFTGYDDANCTGNPGTVDIDSVCHFAANGQNFTGDNHFKYTATPDTMNCAAASATTPVGGSFQVNNPITICCP